MSQYKSPEYILTVDPPMSPPHPFPTRNYALIFDVETTGLLSKNILSGKGVPLENIHDLPYITQISFVLYNINDNRILRTYNQYIRLPKQVVIPDVVTKLTGITKDIGDDIGVDIVDALAHLNGAFRSCDRLVAHNLDFDAKMIEIEAARNHTRIIQRWGYSPRLCEIDYELVRGIERHCTMKSSVDRCNIMVAGSYGKPYKKFPTLAELHQTLFGVIPDGLHDSMVDVIACLDCYIILSQRVPN